MTEKSCLEQKKTSYRGSLIADFNSDGTIAFDPLNHIGYLGDIYTVNGRAFPYFKVQRRKYRLRFLNASNARHVELRLSNGQPFVGISNDSWLLPRAIARDSVLLIPAKRADVIVDFTNAPDELFLENILQQDDGRGSSGKLDRRVTDIPAENVMTFVVEGDPPVLDCSIKIGNELREHIPILPSEIEATRVFEFRRRNGAWQINSDFFDVFKSNARPRVGLAERWTSQWLGRMVASDSHPP